MAPFRPNLTKEELKAARHALGLTAEGFAKLVNIADGRNVRRWESGDRSIPGPVSVLVTAILNSAAVRRYFGLELKDHVDCGAPCPVRSILHRMR